MIEKLLNNFYLVHFVNMLHNLENFPSFQWQKVNGPGFALGETLFGAHKV